MFLCGRICRTRELRKALTIKYFSAEWLVFTVLLQVESVKQFAFNGSGMWLWTLTATHPFELEAVSTQGSVLGPEKEGKEP